MNFVWTDPAHESFSQSPHLNRYLRSDFLLNPPTPQAPLYCVQVASDKNYPLYMIPESYVIIHCHTSVYFLSCEELELVVGRWSKKRTPGGPDPEQRLNTMQDLWDESMSDVHRTRLSPYKLSSMEELYNAIRNACYLSTMPTTTAGDLRAVIQKPLSPKEGIKLGTMETGLVRPTRRGARRVEHKDGTEVPLHTLPGQESHS